jgi:hypothetical protein
MTAARLPPDCRPGVTHDCRPAFRRAAVVVVENDKDRGAEVEPANHTQLALLCETADQRRAREAAEFAVALRRAYLRRMGGCP